MVRRRIRGFECFVVRSAFEIGRRRRQVLFSFVVVVIFFFVLFFPRRLVLVIRRFRNFVVVELLVRVEEG